MDRTKLEVIKGSLASARTWEEKGDSWRNIAWSNKCLSSALMNLISIAVGEFSSQSDAANWLLQNDTLGLLRKVHGQLQRLIAEVEGGQIPASTLGGNHPHLVYAHLSWALHGFSLGEAFISIAERKDIADISTLFWREYAKGMGSLVRCQSYTFPKMRLRGQEEYWSPFLHLIEAAAAGISLEEPLQKINQAFVKRNGDTKIMDDSYETEGTGLHPVKWDYRRDSLLTYIGQRAT